MNERKTEALVDERLRKRHYFKTSGDLIVEKQKSDSLRIQKRLETASKRGSGIGRPEYIIRSKSRPEFVIIIECKADPKKHASPTLDKYADYAVDGSLLYASHLAQDFDVLAIAVSGETDSELKISHHIHLKGAISAVPLAGDTLLSFEEYYKGVMESGAKFRQDYDTLLKYTKKLNTLLQGKKVKEANRGLLISGILIALKNKAFRDSYRSHTDGRELAQSMLQAIAAEIQRSRLSETKREILRHSFSFIATSPPLVGNLDFFIELNEDIDKNINEFVHTHKFYDTIGQFYIEFLRYANNEKGLGIVLTPPHIAELFAGIAAVNKNSILLDNCCGTAGLLLAGMKAMIKDAKGDERLKSSIKSKQIYGIEYQPDIYALAVSNMVLHDDGRTNITRGDCFVDLASTLRGVHPTVGLLNPPYKVHQEDKEELEFVYNNLEALAPGSPCVAIVPFTCATADSGEPLEWKKRIMQHHTVEAVMSMPAELFHNSDTNVITVVMVFTAHKPHQKGKKTWFGYWREDGFVKTKNKGRSDDNDTWEGIKAKWLSAYRNRETIDGFSLMQEVKAEDEWCAEAYMTTNYGAITEADFVQTLRKYAAFKIRYADEVGQA